MASSTFLWQAIEVLAATDGILVDDVNWQAKKISIDSRSIEPGDLFIAIKGQNDDGHKYLQQAYVSGGVAAIVDHQTDNLVNIPLVDVADTKQALNSLGVYNRSRVAAKTIGVTGSAGKTSTKEALRIAFSSQGNTYANYGNYNNEYGVPLSLSNMPLETEFSVFEMGMNKRCEIARLAAQVRPDIAIITNIAAAHLEFFESVEKIAEAKAEIFTGMDQDGFAILNKDDNYFQKLEGLAKSNSIYNIISYGENNKADCQLIKYSEDELGSNITADILGNLISYRLSNPGMHHARNSLAVLAAVYAAKGDVAQAAESLFNFTPLKGRGQRHILTRGDKKFLLIDDSYNANPASMKAALNLLGNSGNSASRKLAIISDMRELGPNSVALHIDLSYDIENNNIDKLIAIGDNMRSLYYSVPESKRLAYFTHVNELIPIIDDYISHNDVILIKGSLGTQIFKLVESLVK